MSEENVFRDFWREGFRKVSGNRALIISEVGILFNSLCLTELPSMGKNCWFICIDPLREFVRKGVGLGYILAFLLCKAHCIG